MKVMAVLHYEKTVVIDVLDPEELEIPMGDGGSSRQPNWDARNKIMDLADKEAENVDLDWVYSDYFKEAKPGDEDVVEFGESKFENVEWFDI